MKDLVQTPVISQITNWLIVLKLLLIDFRFLVPIEQQPAASSQPQEKIKIAKYSGMILVVILIILLFSLNWWWVASNGNYFYIIPREIAILGVANILFLAVSARWNAAAIGAGNDRQSRKPDECDRFFNISPDLLCVVGFDGCLKHFNPAAEKIFGYSPAEMLGQPFIEFVHPDDREATLKEAESITAGNPTICFENRWRCRDGTYKWLMWNASPFCEEELIYGVGRDITDRKIVEAALLKSNILFESILESTADSIFVKDIQSHYLLINSNAAAVMGKPKIEILGKNDADFFQPEIAAQLVETDRRIIESGSKQTLEEIIKDSDGNILTFLSTKSPLRDREKNIIGVVGVVRDISDIKQAETALRLSEQRLQLALWGSDSGIWDWNLVTDEIYCSPEYSALLGYEPAELEPSAIGLGKIIHPDDMPVLAEKLNAYLADSDSSYAVEYRMLAKSGEFKWVLARGKVVERDLNNAPLRMIGTISDISDRIAAEAEMRQQKEFLRTIYDSVNYSIFVIDVGADGEFRYAGWNRAAELFGNISSEFGCGKTPEELFPAPTAAFFRQKLRECLLKDRSISYEETVIFETQKVEFITTLTPLRDESGKICRLVGSATDITDRKTAEAQLREQEEFLNSIYNGANQVIFVVDVGEDGEFRYVGWNATTEASTGLLAADIKGKTPEEIFPPTVAADFRQRYIDCLEAGSSIYYENSADADNIENWFVVALTPLRDASGRIYRLIGNSTNITERKKAEAALQESQRFVERIANATPNILYLFDEVEQRNVYANREITSILGYTVEEAQALGSNLLPTIIHPDDLAKLPQYFQELEKAPDGEVIEYEYRVRNKNNSWHWLVSREIVFSRTESGKIQQRLGAATDVTDRKQAEQALAEQLKLSVFTADVGIALTQNQTLPATLQKCCDAVVRHLDAAFARIWTLNDAENVLELQASGGMYTHIDGAHSRVSVGHLKIGLIAKERIPYLSNEVLEDARIGDKEWASREGMVAFAGYPLVVDNQLVGVIAMFSREELNESTLIALASIADAIALGIKRKQTEEALARQQQTLRSIIDNAPIWVWMTNANGQMLLVNKTFCEDVAIRESRFLAASHYSEVLGAEVSANCMASDVQAWSQNTPSYAEEVLQLADGKEHYLETIKTQVKDAAGNSIGLIGLGLDVTEQKEAQRKLQESEARFRKLAEQEALLNQLASNIRASLDLDTILATTVHQIRELLQLDRCLFIWYLPDASPPAWDVVHEAKNDDLFSIVGYYPADITGTLPQNIASLEVYQIDDVTTVSDELEREFLMQLGYKSVLDLPIKSADGLTGVVACISCSEVRRWTKEEVELIGAIGDQLAIAISQSELYSQSVDSARIAQEQAKQLEVALCELQQAQTQLVQAEKMSSLGQMVAGIAHEINNPVSFIFGNLTYTEEYTASIMKLLQMYRDEFPEPPPAIRDAIDSLELDFLLDDLPKMLSSMQVGATRIRDIVRSLRNFSRLDESDMKKVNIHEGIDSTLMILEHRLKAHSVSVAGTEYHRPAIQVVKEYGQLPLVECYAGQLNQVFMNIIANAIDVLADNIQNPGIIRIRTGVEDNFAAIAISDNGAGISDKVKQRIFDPFFTTKPIGSGTGMGLAISHSIVVEKHKGNINCISAVGKGTEFVIKIPILSQ